MIQTKEIQNSIAKTNHIKMEWLHRFISISYPMIIKYKKYNLKIQKALHNLALYPIDISKASFEEFLQIPGISIQSAKQLILLRFKRGLDFYDIQKSGGKLYIAKHFICLNQTLPPVYSFHPDRKKQSNLQYSLF